MLTISDLYNIAVGWCAKSLQLLFGFDTLRICRFIGNPALMRYRWWEFATASEGGVGTGKIFLHFFVKTIFLNSHLGHVYS